MNLQKKENFFKMEEEFIDVKFEKGNCCSCKNKNVLVVEQEIEGDFGTFGINNFCLKCFSSYDFYNSLQEVYVDLT